MVKNIAILTSGGDAPGMNLFISYMYKFCDVRGYNLFAVKKGFQGLIENSFTKMDFDDIKNVSFLGGSVIKSTRSKDFLLETSFKKAIDNINKNNIDLLVVLGGNGSLIGAKKMTENGVKIIFVPTTIDNDIYFTEQSIGFDTAVQNNVEAIDKLKLTSSASDRGFIIEVMGRNSGHIALKTAIAAAVQDVIIQEVKKSTSEVVEKIKQAIMAGVDAPGVVVSENQMNINALKDKLIDKTGKDFRVVNLGHVQRGGSPTANDRLITFRYLVGVFNLINRTNFESSAVLLKDYKIGYIRIVDVDSKSNNSKINLELYNLFNSKNI